jgi:hypothetical protein
MPARSAMKLVLVAVAVATLAACSDDKGPASPPRLAGLQVLPATAGPVSIPLGVAVSFSAVGTYTDGTKRDVTGEVVWSSSSDAVAAISNTPGSAGIATAVAMGDVSITASDPAAGVSSSVDVTVIPAEVVSLAVSPTDPTILIGNTVQLQADGTLTDETLADLTSSVTWSSSDEAIATVSQSGVVTAIAIGIATVTARDPVSGETASTSVEVTDVPAALSYVGVSRGSIVGGGPVQISGIIVLTSAAVEPVTVTLTSSNVAALQVVPEVVIIPAGEASATFAIETFTLQQRTKVTITATDGSSTKTATVNVRRTR